MLHMFKIFLPAFALFSLVGTVNHQEEIDSKTKDAIDKGLEWLSRNQNRDGSFGNGNANMAATAFAGLAFLSGGHTPTRGPYADNVKKAVEYMLKHVSKEGYINEGVARRGAGGSGMHGHGYAVLFLASVYGMAGPEYDSSELKEKLTKAIKLTEKSQTKDGGWYYEPKQQVDEGSVTITQVSALRAARNAGISVNLEVIKKALKYITTTTNEQGWTQYQFSGKNANGQSVALTAAGAAVLTYLGEYKNKKLDKMLNNIMKNLPGKSQLNTGFYFYGNLYMAIATHQSGSKFWDAYFTAAKKEMFKMQSNDGGFKTGEGASYGPAFSTGIALMILQMPYRYLPIFQSASE